MYQLLKNYLGRHVEVTEQQLEVFCSKFKLKITKRNEILLETGRICRHMYFVNKGCLRVYLVNKKARESTRILIPAGNFGTAFPSFILQEPSQAYIQSIEASEILLLTYQDFRDLPNLLPGWEKLYQNNLEQAYIASIKRIESLITMSAKERYALFMENNPDLVQSLPSKIIADFLGISQETLSRLKSKK